MKKHLSLFSLICFLLCVLPGLATAEGYEHLPFELTVPAGFEGPKEFRPGLGAVVLAFSKPHEGAEKATLLQINTYDFGDEMPRIPERELGNVAENYLLQFMRGVERRRTDYSVEPVKRGVLGGVPSASIEWSGILDGEPMRGVMHCAVVGSVVTTFHVQDFIKFPPENFERAISAIHSVERNGG